MNKANVQTNATPQNEIDQRVLELRLESYLNCCVKVYSRGGTEAVISNIIENFPTPEEFFKIGRKFYRLKTIRFLCRLIGMNIQFAFYTNRHYIVYRIYEKIIHQEGIPNWRNVKF